MSEQHKQSVTTEEPGDVKVSMATPEYNVKTYSLTVSDMGEEIINIDSANVQIHITDEDDANLSYMRLDYSVDDSGSYVGDFSLESSNDNKALIRMPNLVVSSLKLRNTDIMSKNITVKVFAY